MSLWNRAPPPPGVTQLPDSSVFASSSASSPSAADHEDGECKLLGPFAIIVQGALGALALLSLVYKRWRERPQRPLKIWGFDVSKQVVGSILLHLVNLAMSEISSGTLSMVAAAAKGVQAPAEATPSDGTEGADAAISHLRNFAARWVEELAKRANQAQASSGAQNPCSFYLLNLAIDTTLGIPILIMLLKVVTHAARVLTPLAKPPESIDSGNYGNPPKTTWWLKQCLIYFVGLLGMKLCVFGIFQICPWLGAVGDWALRWTEGDENLQIIFVMLLFPLIMNAMQYYIIDSFIKEQKPKETYEEVTQDEDSVIGDEGAGESGRGSMEDTNDVAKGDTSVSASSTERSGRPREDQDKRIDYDPLIDGARVEPAAGRPSTEETSLLGSDVHKAGETQRR